MEQQPYKIELGKQPPDMQRRIVHAMRGIINELAKLPKDNQTNKTA